MKWVIISTSLFALALGAGGCATSVTDSDTSSIGDEVYTGSQSENSGDGTGSGNIGDFQRYPFRADLQPGAAEPSTRPGPVPWYGETPPDPAACRTWDCAPKP